MRSRRAGSAAFWLFSVLQLSAASIAEPLGQAVDGVKLAPGGEWSNVTETHLTLNERTNRLLTVVRSGDPDPNRYYKVLSFDAATKALASESVLQTTSGVYLRGIQASSKTNELFIAYDSNLPFGSANPRNPHFVQIFNLETFSSSPTVRVPVGFFDFDKDPDGRRMIGLSPPHMGETTYRLSILEADTRIVTSVPIGMPRWVALPQDMVFDASRERLLVLYSPYRIGAMNEETDPEGFVAAYDAVTGATVARSSNFPGTFTTHSLAISPDGEWVAVAPDSSHQGMLPLLSGESLASASPFVEGSPDFQSIGALGFVQSDRFWVGNGKESLPEKSIAVFQIGQATPTGYIRDASESTVFLKSSLSTDVFVASTDIGALYILSPTATRVSTQLDVEVTPFDLAVDRVGNLFAALSKEGRLYLVSDLIPGATSDRPRLFSRRPGLGARPRAGLFPDEARARLFVGRQPMGHPEILETNGYQPLGQLPTAAEALILDASRNLIYTLFAASPTNPGLGQVVAQIDGGSLAVSDPQLASLTDTVIAPIQGIEQNIELAHDPVAETLWIATPRFPFKSAPKLRALDVSVGFVRAFSFPDSSLSPSTLNHLYLDLPRNRVLAVHDRGNDEVVFAFDLDSDPLLPSSQVPIPNISGVLDYAADPARGLLYYLTLNTNGTLYELLAWSLESDSVTRRFELPFLGGSGSVGLTLNPTTDRFAVVASPSSRMYLFDNPITTPKLDKVPTAMISAQVVQATVGITLSWSVEGAPPDTVRGWIIERRRDPSEDTPPHEGWQRLTSVPLPSTLTTWTDLSVEPGTAYLYRIRAAVLGSQLPSPAAIGPVSSNPGEGDWLVNAPDVEVRLHPGDSAELLLSLSSEIARGRSIQVSIQASAGFTLEASPALLPAPGAAVLTLAVAANSFAGVYALTASLSDGVLEVPVSFLVSVLPNTTSIRGDRIPRRATRIALSRDSELSGARLSIRGQLGIERALANPTGIFVEARRPDGAIVSATGVVAATGEFTAEFAVPDDNPPGEYWYFRATWPGSPDGVGGASPRFPIPVYAPSAGKGNEEPDLGEIITLVGAPPNARTQGAIELTANDIHKTFLGGQVGDQVQHVLSAGGELGDIVDSTPTFENLLDIVENKIRTSRFVLFYLLGNARVANNTVEFLLPDQKVLSAGQLAQLVAGSTKHGAEPLIVIDSPYAGNYESMLEDFPGAHVFSCRQGQRRVVFGTGGFSDYFLEAIRSPLGFGEAFISARDRFTTRGANVGSGIQKPSANRVGDEPFKTLPVLSAFTPPVALIRDSIPPKIELVTPTRNVAVGSTLEVSARVTDPPFGLPVEATVEVFHPDGWREAIPLERDSADPDLYRGQVHSDLPGFTVLRYHARDARGNLDVTDSMVLSPSGARIDGALLLEALEAAGNQGESGALSGRAESILWWAASEWMSFEGSR
ncbi:MAG: fibronectin type III domain-containing protein [Candidatus Omnitrophica bacterium]|nr:fibronectin type III domain-containing protein [Candidatus Omnitrophota bacterium]